MKILYTALVINLSWLSSYSQQIRNPEVRTDTLEIHKKLVEASHIARGFIYRFDKVDNETTEEFLNQAVKLDFTNLKILVDRADRATIDEQYYDELFVKFPKEFDKYLQQYLLRLIVKGLEKAKVNKATHAVISFNAAKTSLNLIDGSLLIQPRNKTLLTFKREAQNIINETQFAAQSKFIGETIDSKH